MLDMPRPSRSTSTSTSVSLVARLTRPLRISSPVGLTARFYQGRVACATLRPPGPNCASMAKCLHHARFPDACMQSAFPEAWHGTTILTVRKHGSVVIGGDGQVSIGQTVVKANAKKVRRLGKGD